MKAENKNQPETPEIVEQDSALPWGRRALEVAGGLILTNTPRPVAQIIGTFLVIDGVAGDAIRLIFKKDK